jgi:hypothetical protein
MKDIYKLLWLITCLLAIIAYILGLQTYYMFEEEIQAEEIIHTVTI